MQEKNAPYSFEAPGAHPIGEDGFTYRFSVYAPHASSVHLVGDSFGWEHGRPMTAKDDGIWEYTHTQDTSLVGQRYKFKIVNKGKVAYRKDPFAKEVELGGGGASVILQETDFPFADGNWIAFRQKQNSSRAPLHVYELDPALFEAKDYASLAEASIPHLKSLGVTHALLPPFSETYPDSSLGNYRDFAFFVNACHANGMGVLYSLTDALPESLSRFDGEDLFESSASPQAYDLSSPFALSYLIHAAKELTDRFHIDGFLLAFAANAELASQLRAICPQALLLAHSPNGKKPEAVDFLWDTARRQALDAYFACDPYFRKHHHHALSLPSEDSLLPEYDGKDASRMSRFFGNYGEKFANNRLAFTFSVFTSGRFSTFSANEVAPFDKKGPAQWFMLDFEPHRRFFELRKALGALYLANPCLWQTQATLFVSDAENNVVVLQKGDLVGIFHFSAVPKELSLSLPGEYRLLFSSEDSVTEPPHPVLSSAGEQKRIDLPPLCAVILQQVDPK